MSIVETHDLDDVRGHLAEGAWVDEGQFTILTRESDEGPWTSVLYEATREDAEYQAGELLADEDVLAVAVLPPDPTRKRREFIAGLRELADYLEENPGLPTDAYEEGHDFHGPALDLHVHLYSGHGAIDPKAVLANATRAPGRWDKSQDEYSYTVQRKFGPVRYILAANRDVVCEQVTVGTETVEKPEPAAEQAINDAIEALYTQRRNLPTIEVEQDKVEWDCKPLRGEDS